MHCDAALFLGPRLGDSARSAGHSAGILLTLRPEESGETPANTTRAAVRLRAHMFLSGTIGRSLLWIGEGATASRGCSTDSVCAAA